MASSALQTAISQLRDGRAGRMSVAIESWLEAERDQLPLWIPVALAGGIAMWFALPDARWWLGFMVGCAGLAMAGVTIGQGTRLARIVTVGAVVLAIGCALIWTRSLVVAAPVLDRPVVARMTAAVEGVEPLAALGIVRIVARPNERPDLPRRVRINIPDDKVPEGLGEGARITLRARLMPPAQPALPGGYDFARRAWFEGLGATGSVLGPVRVVVAAPPGPNLRHRLSRHVQAQVDGPAGAIAATLATGDRGALPEADAEAMRRSGLAHLLSISGLHVTAVVAAAFLLALRLLALSPRLALNAPLMLIAAGSGAVAGMAYTLLTGAQVPTVRSCVAAMLVLIALAIGREAITLRLIAAGAIFVMVFWPESIMGPSFQLSFAAVTAIVALHRQPQVRAWFTRREEGRVWRWLRGLASLFLTGVVVELALMPIALFHFHKAGLYGALANVVAIPLTTFVIMPLEALALVLDAVGIGAPIWWLTGQALDALLALAHYTASRPGAVTLLPSMVSWPFAATALAGLWFAIFRTRVRWAALPVLAIGVGTIASARAPDLVVTGDGRHVAARDTTGQVSLLRDRAGDYVRDMIVESIATDLDLLPLRDRADARCSRDFCVWLVGNKGRQYSVMATTSGYFVDALDLIRACERVDIVIADRGLPKSCTPRWLKADRYALARSGGLAIFLDPPRVRTTFDAGDRHPWRKAAQKRRPYQKSARKRVSGSGAATRPGDPERAPAQRRKAAAGERNSPDRAGPSVLRDGNI